MQWNFAELDRARRYKLLVGLVVPWPIALITSVNAAGVVNAALFSFFNVMGDEPPIVIVSIEDRDSGAMKDSARNIGESGEFVVNLVDEAIAEKMHACSVDYPATVSEIDTRHLLIGQVRHLHVRDELIDPVTFRVKMDNYRPVGRLFANQYARTNDRFGLEANAYLGRMAAAGRT